VVLAMPSKENALQQLNSEYEAIRSGQMGTITREMSSRLTEISALRNQIEESARESYTSPHFDTPNYVAHMRLNERVDAKGKPGLFIEELQSDRHQQGREKGYAGEKEQSYFAKESTDPRFRGRWYIEDKDGNVESRPIYTRQVAEEAALKMSQRGTVPDAPFRTSWPLQLFKRALRDAVADGKEWIGWTTGETQAARYDLSKQIDRLTVTEDQNIIGSYRVQAFKDGGGAIDKTVKGEELPDVIGKDLAQKVIDNIQESRQRAKPDYSTTLTGLDLKVGGEGMKGFYDTMVPKDVAKYVKQWGAQVEKDGIKTRELEVEGARKYEVSPESSGYSIREIATGQMYRGEGGRAFYFNSRNDATLKIGELHRSLREAKTIPIWRVNITPQMREGIKKAGQALFVGGAAAVVAEDQLE
jgi:hypothetical protein